MGLHQWQVASFRGGGLANSFSKQLYGQCLRPLVLLQLVSPTLAVEKNQQPSECMSMAIVQQTSIYRQSNLKFMSFSCIDKCYYSDFFPISPKFKTYF